MKNKILKKEFAIVYEKNKELMFRLAYNILHNVADADEAMSEAVLKAWENIDNLRDVESLRSWMVQIVINTAKTITTTKDSAHEYLTEDMSAYQDEITLHTDNDIWEIISSMDEKYSTVIIMFYYRDMSLNEISSILGLPTGTVKSRLARGRNILKDEMLKEGGEHHGEF